MALGRLREKARTHEIPAALDRPDRQVRRHAEAKRRAAYPLVAMLEPTLACNLACIGYGKIREYESNKARLSVDECIDAGVQCPAPVVSICGGEP